MLNNPIQPLKIGDLEINIPVLLAPMAGITDWPYREMVNSFGANMVYSEMISSVSMAKGVSGRTAKMSYMQSDTTACIGLQLAGSDLELLSIAAKFAQDQGASLIDINMGCPVKKVVKGIAGSALMQDEILAGKIMETVVNAVDIPVTLKTRLGWDEQSLNASQLAKIAERSGIQLITIHGRTRQQFFSGSANWHEVAKVKNSVNIPVIVNGDIHNIHDTIDALNISGADGVMIGRATYGKPWLINEISHYLQYQQQLPPVTLEQKLNSAIKHYNMLIDYYGNAVAIKLARKHLGWYTKGLANSTAIRAKINQSTDYHEVLALLYQCFEQAHEDSITTVNQQIADVV